MSEIPHLQLAEPVIDTREVYAPSRERSLQRLDNGGMLLALANDFDITQKSEVIQEAELCGINPNTDPDKFVEAHNSLIAEVDQGLSERLPGIKQSAVTKIAKYFHPNDPRAEQDMSDTLTSRLTATNIRVADNLANKWLRGGGFDSASRQILIGSAEIPRHMNSAESAEDFYKQISDEVVTHEVIHGMLASGRQQLPKREANIRNGLRLEIYWHEPEVNKVRGYRYAQWVNEAAIESLRQIATGTEDVRYGSEVMILQMLDELSPGLKDELMLAAIDGKGPGIAFGKMESLLGPTCIDHIEELLEKYNFSQMDEFKDEIVRMLPESLREQGSEILDKKEAEIMTGRPYYEAWKDYYRQQAEIKNDNK
jgi:hypothetical protein